MNEKISLIRQKEKVMQEYISKIKNKYENVKPMIRQISVVGQKVGYTKKTLMGIDKINEEMNEDDMVNGSFGSDYDNEQNEESDIDKDNKNEFDQQVDLKMSVFVEKFKVRKNKNLKKSVVDGIIKIESRHKIKKEKRAHSK